MEDDLEKRIADLEGRPAEPEPDLVIFPALNQPAPDWVGPLFLAIPFTAVVIYFVVRFIKSRR